tara:strand:- start:998 stop:1603 length:606 start_codon:yes stop_codon:yes gene_type:complete
MSYLADVQMPVKEEISVAEQSEEEQVWEASDESEEELEVLPPTELPAKKEKIQMDDIFKPKAPPAKKELQIREKPVILPKIAPVKQKRKMSEKQLEALARGRANRAKNKKPAPVAAPVAAPVEAPAPAPAPAPVQQRYSQQDLEEMVFQGVQRYDTQRKKRKEVKKKALAKQTHEKKVFSDINNALERTVPTSDPWANCFT